MHAYGVLVTCFAMSLVREKITLSPKQKKIQTTMDTEDEYSQSTNPESDEQQFAKPPTGRGIKSKTLFLTYPRAPNEWTHDTILRILRNRSATPVNYCIARERHATDDDSGQNRQFHFHALVRYDKKLDCSMVAFDFEGRHPSILVPFNPDGLYSYITEPSSKKTGFPWLDDTEHGLLDTWNTNVWKRVVEQAEQGSVQGGLNELKLFRPDIVVKDYERVKRNLELIAESRKRSHDQAFDPRLAAPRPWKPNEVADAWVSQHLNYWQPHIRFKTLILVGPTGTGKTLWALTRTPQHSFINNTWNLAALKPDSKLNIIDDFNNWEDLWRGGGKSFLTNNAYMQTTSTDKYMRKQLIKPKPLIICCNVPALDKLRLVIGEDEWFDNNTVIVPITAPMWS